MHGRAGEGIRAARFHANVVFHLRVVCKNLEHAFMADSKVAHLRKASKTSSLVVATEAAVIEALSKSERADLSKCEKVIGRGWHTFLEVGRALNQVREGKLYRESHPTFEAYCRERWQYGKAHAYRLIGSVEVVEDLSPIGDGKQPINESQVRPLIALSKDERVKAWKTALDSAGTKPLTARLVQKAALPFLPKKRRKRSAGSRDTTHWKDATTALGAAIKAAAGNESVLDALRRVSASFGKLRKSL